MGILTPTDCTCNICGGADGLVSVTAVNFNTTFVPGEAVTLHYITCAKAEAAGFGGELEPLRCGIYSPLAWRFCNAVAKKVERRLQPPERRHR